MVRARSALAAYDGEGFSNREIAARLTGVYRTLGLRGRVELRRLPDLPS